jgi:protein JSN1
MPQRGNIIGGTPFGSSVFASNWMAGRDRASTLQSIRSSEGPSSPGQSPADNDVRTLDYLGLVDSPQPPRGGFTHAEANMLASQQRQRGNSGFNVADMAALNSFSKNPANRFRSYSVNNKEKYADGDEDDELSEYEQLQQMYGSGAPIPSSREAAAAQAAAIHEAVRQHNLDVQAFATYASSNRPRARTAGVLDSPANRTLRNYLPTPSRLDNSMSASDLQGNEVNDLNVLASAVQGMNLAGKSTFSSGLEAPMEAPTRSLWLGNIPSSTTVSSLNVIFGQFGSIEFARVLTHKSCGFVNFENIQSAVTAKDQCNGKEIFPGCGPIRIGFAKEQSASNTPGANGMYPSPSPDPFVAKGGAVPGVIGQPSTNVNADTAAAALVTPDLLQLREEVLNIVSQFGASAEELPRIEANLDKAMNYEDFALEVPPIGEPSHSRIHDAPRLRDIRKRIDNNSCTALEIEAIATEMLPEIAELASDYLGNTVVQKLFEHCSEETKEAMLTEIVPQLAEIGVHKNGTWAAQKIIDVARTPKQMSMIADSLRPHAVNLFLDQYGNYVMQCCLRFQSPINDFIFESMLNRLWDVSQGRFGARAMRACLESHFATTDQKRLMAAAITLHSVQLATSSNGALLLTWFLDTCTFPRRRSVLAPRLIPHLIHLCTHKVAYLTVLKIINQRNEPEARDSILRALFEDQTLQSIVSDQACGATFIFKVLTTPFLDDSIRPECVENVRNVLLRLKAQPSQGYKRLMDEVGLSTRHGGTPVSHDGRSNSKSRAVNGHLGQLDTNQNGFPRPPYAPMQPQNQHQPIDHALGGHGLQRTISMDSTSFDPYAHNGLMTPQYTHSPAMSSAGISPISQQQLQYQQAMLAQQHQQVPRPAGFYNSPGAAYGNASPGPQQMQYQDPYRQGNHMMQQPPPGMHAGYPPPQQQGYGQVMGGGYGQYGAPPPPPQFIQQGGGGRRGRVGR